MNADPHPLNGLTPRQRKAVEALAEGGTYASAAEAAGVSERSLFEWRRKAAFVEAVRVAQDELFAEARGELRSASADAVRTLREVMGDAEAPATARVRAALGVLGVVGDLLDREERKDSNAAFDFGDSGLVDLSKLSDDELEAYRAAVEKGTEASGTM